MPREMDPRFARFAANRTSRRRFIGGGAAAAAAFALGPSFLAACGSDSGTSGTTTQDGGPASGTLRVSNWPLYMADGFVAAFQTGQRASRSTTRKTSTTTSSGSPRSRNRCRASRTSAPTWWCPPQFMATRVRRAGLAQRDQRGRCAQQARTCAPTCSTRRSTRAASAPRRTCPAWSGSPTTAPPPDATSPRSTTCGIRRSRAASACSRTSRTVSGMIMQSPGQ